MNINKLLAQELNISETQINNTVRLIDDGNTIPFIARYRKEATGELDDQLLRRLYDRLMALRALKERKEDIVRLISEQGKLTPEIGQAIEKASTLNELEDIYRPYRPKKRTRASIAKEKGLEPLAMLFYAQNLFKGTVEELAVPFLNEQVLTTEEALSGAVDILAEFIADNADFRKAIRALTLSTGVICTKAAKEAESVYQMYADFKESLNKLAKHRVLAIDRGEKEEYLNVKISADEEKILWFLLQHTASAKRSVTTSLVEEAAREAYKRLIAPSIEREIRNMLTESAGEQAIKVFATNLSSLLMQPPVKNRTVLGLDPAFRTGCKTAVVDSTGKVLDTAVIYCTLDNHDKEKAKLQLIRLIEKHHADIISIGNGTASKETEIFVSDALKELPRKVYYMIVNEAGASVYSASKLASEEFPEFDVALRGAISIARRIQDPLAELVKIEPKAIGVGQYQHDMNQKRLDQALEGVVEDCVNRVGVDLNTASASLLHYIAGINTTVAKNIVKYREKNGRFQRRKDLLKVSKLGEKAFEQCAGFLRIPNGQYILDNTSVHPESYGAAEKLLKKLGYSLEDAVENKISDIQDRLQQQNMSVLAQELGIGLPTLKDIVVALKKRGLDPREELAQPVLRSDIMKMEDLRPDMVLTGTVRNAIDFGVFVDIGVHQDGLVHISQISDKFIKHPTEAVSVGDIVQVKVLDVDIKRKRISLTMKI